jgi:hypothetical protein
MTQYYLGIKVVMAWPETKDCREGYAVKYSDGYISWSPKETFESAYLPIGSDPTAWERLDLKYGR